MRTLPLVALLLSGCIAGRRAEGERPAILQFTRFKTDLFFKERAIHLRQVDGRTVGGRRPSYTEEIELAPGDHTIKFYYYDSDGDGPGVPGELSLTARAGGRYLVAFEPSEIRLKTAVWIEDRGTGEVIGGRAPAAKPAAPSAEVEIVRAEWRTIPPQKALKLYAKSGRTFSGSMIGSDGEYLWFQQPDGGKKALLLSEIDKIAALK